MDQQIMTSRNFFKANQIVHIAFIIGLVFFALISFFLQLQGFGSLGQEFNRASVFIVPVIAICGIIASKLTFKRKLNDCIGKTSLKDKLTEYRSALIIKFAIIEVATFITILSYLLTGDLILLAIVGFLIIVFATYRPSKEKLFLDLELSQPEKQLLNPTCKFTFVTISISVKNDFHFYNWGTTFIFLVKGRCLNPSAS